MSTNCHDCGYRDNEVKTGGAISDKGRRTILKVEDSEDLSRDILKVRSQHPSSTIPDDVDPSFTFLLSRLSSTILFPSLFLPAPPPPPFSLFLFNLYPLHLLVRNRRSHHPRNRPRAQPRNPRRTLHHPRRLASTSLRGAGRQGVCEGRLECVAGGGGGSYGQIPGQLEEGAFWRFPFLFCRRS
jgi:hypothetical protein